MDLSPEPGAAKHGYFLMIAFTRILARATASVVLSLSTGFAVEIIAHRGASFDAPENSLSAIKLAWEQNADAVELDIWLSKDGRLLVFHDKDTKRIGKVDKKITEYTLEEAAKLDVGSWKDPKFTGERMPTLESILDTIPEGKRAVIELKDAPHIVPELVRVLRASKKPAKQLAVISFNYDTLAASRKALPELEHYFLYGYKKDAKTGEFPQLAPIVAKSKAAEFTGLDLHFDWPIDKKFVADLKAQGLKLVVWTVNDGEVARKLAAAGVDGITTDRPAWLREQLKK
jgi:glycerophosphoryl diester phosphodiesterase